MRTGAAISVAAHLVALTACLVLAGVRPFEPTTAEAITVDIITPDQAPPLPKEPELPAPSDKETGQTEEPQQTPAETTPQQAAPPPEQTTQQAALQQQPIEPPKPAEPQKPAEPAKPAEQPKPAERQQAEPSQPPPSQQEPQAIPTASPDITSRYGMMFTLPDAGAVGDFDAKATAKANIRAEDAAALRARLKECAVLPKSVSPSDNVQIVLRVALNPDGRLAQEPLLIEASASAKGPLLMRSAMDALEKCQPYTMLPADRYNEWRMLDLSFAPRDFRGG